MPDAAVTAAERALLPDRHEEAKATYAPVTFAISRAVLVVAGVVEDAIRPFGLPVREVFALVEAVGDPGQTQIELSTRTRIDRSTLVGVIDRLEAGGYVERRPVPGDRRARSIVPTARGIDVVEQVRPAIAAAEREVLDALGPDGPLVVQRLLELVHGPLGARADGQSFR